MLSLNLLFFAKNMNATPIKAKKIKNMIDMVIIHTS